MSLDFSGERYVPGVSSSRMEADHLARYEFARDFVAGKEVLDIACGAGYGSALLAEAGAARVHGVDISEEAIGHARELYGSDRTQFDTGDLYAFDPGTRYDVIVSFATIEHVDDHEAALANLHRLLRSGGRLIVSSPNRPITSPRARSLDDRPANPYHVREFTVPELCQALERHGFRVAAGDVFGQRQQRHFRLAPLNLAYRMLFKPKRRADPSVTAIRGLEPRYMVIVASKAPQRGAAAASRPAASAAQYTPTSHHRICDQ